MHLAGFVELGEADDDFLFHQYAKKPASSMKSSQYKWSFCVSTSLVSLCSVTQVHGIFRDKVLPSISRASSILLGHSLFKVKLFKEKTYGSTHMREIVCMDVVLRVVLCRFWSEVQDYEFTIHNKGKYLVISLHFCVADLSI